MGVTKYLLKPLRHDELKETLHSILEKIEKENDDNKRINQLSRQNNSYLISLRRHFLSQLLTYNYKFQKPLNEMVTYLQLPWEESHYYCVALIGPLNQNTTREYDKYTDISAEILTLIQLSFELPFNGQACEAYYGLVAVVFAVEHPVSNNDLFAELEKYRLLIEDSTNENIYIGVSGYVNDLAGIPSATSFALEAFQKNRLNSSSFIRFSETDANALFIKQHECFKLDQLLALINSNTPAEKIDTYIKELKHKISKMGSNFECLNLLYLDFLRKILYIAKNSQNKNFTYEILNEISGINQKIKEEILFEKIEYWINRANEAEKNSGFVKNTPFVDEAIKYISEHYHDPMLTIDTLSKELHVNYAYLCSVFKRDTDVTINKFIKQLRLNEARELIRNSDKTISEIAIASGFQNTNYFSKCFKKEFGVSPSDLLRTQK